MLSADLIKKHKYYNYKFFAKWAWLYDYEKYFTFLLKQKAFVQPKKPVKVPKVNKKDKKEAEMNASMAESESQK